jgi:predicted dehydrogenase
MPLRVGLVGAGTVSQAHLPAYRDHGTLELAAVCDADAERAADVAEEFGLESETWADFEDFAAEAPVDAIDVCLPHHLHHPAAAAALEAGKHVHVEKPLATDAADCVDLVDRAAQRDLRLAVGQMQRFDPGYRALKRHVEAGDLGRVWAARADGIQNLRDYAEPSHWLYDGDRAGGGVVASVLVHKLDLLRYLLGDVARVSALSDSASPDFENGAEDYCVGLLEFECGTRADLFATYSASEIPYGESVWLYGDEGVAYDLPGEGEYRGEVRIGTGDGFRPVDSSTALPTDDGFVNELLHFADCVESGTESIASGRDNLGTVATVFALYESAARDGEWVRPVDLLRVARREA